MNIYSLLLFPRENISLYITFQISPLRDNPENYPKDISILSLVNINIASRYPGNTGSLSSLDKISLLI